MSELLFGTTLLASFLGGVVALLAPCCVSVMLPAYLSTGFRHRGGVLPATLVFAAGVATVILPIGLGATALSRLLVGEHLWVFLTGGVLMIAGGVATLAGWTLKLPMPGMRARASDGSFGSAYLLGAFSGAASACCAPVLAGVAVLSGASASFPAALSIGLAYVAGMVVPLSVIALLWDRRRERASRLLTSRDIQLRMGGWQRRMPLGTLVSGVLLIAMGVLAGILAFTGPGMNIGGWQTAMSAWLQHATTVAVDGLAWLPGWVVAVVIAVVVALLIHRGWRTHLRRSATGDSPRSEPAEDNAACPAAAVDEEI